MNLIINLLGPSVAQAASLNPITVDTSISEIFINIMNSLVVPVMGALALGTIIWAGFKFITSQGDPDKLKSAKAALLWAIVGLIVVVSSWVIVVYLNCIINNSCP